MFQELVLNAFMSTISSQILTTAVFYSIYITWSLKAWDLFNLIHFTWEWNKVRLVCDYIKYKHRLRFACSL